MTPIGHVAIAVPAGYVIRLNPMVVFICALLPDLIDKPLEALGIGAARYVAHTLLFMFVVSIALFLWKKRYGLSAAFGITSHLFLDWFDAKTPVVPWFYPFRDYNFPEPAFDLFAFIPNLTNTIQSYALTNLPDELVYIAATIAIVFIANRLHKRYGKKAGGRK